MIKSILKELSRKNVVELNVTEDKISVMKLDGRRDVNGMVSFLVWTTPSKDPTYYLKLPRGLSNNNLLSKEFQNLLELQKIVKDNVFLECVPRPIYNGVVNGYSILLTSVVIGRPLYIDFQDPLFTSKQTLRSYIDLSLQWLLDFQTAMFRRIDSTPYLVEQWFDQPVTKFLEIVGNEYQAFAHALLGELKKFFRGKVILASAHCDYSPYNIILVRENKIGVIDWESYHSCTIPLFDFFHFFVVTSLLLPNSGKSYETGYYRYLCGDTWYSSFYKSRLKTYIHKWGWPSELTECVFPLFLINRALIEFEEPRENLLAAKMWVEFLNRYIKDCEGYH
jgi:hypothetical protein